MIRRRHMSLCLTAATSSVTESRAHMPRSGASHQNRSGCMQGDTRGSIMEVAPPAHAGPGAWLALPSVGRIASFGLLVLALLLFYEQVKMFLYRCASSLCEPASPFVT